MDEGDEDRDWVTFKKGTDKLTFTPPVVHHFSPPPSVRPPIGIMIDPLLPL